MRLILVILIVFVSFSGHSKNKKTIYYGVNGKLENFEKNELKKTIQKNIFGKTLVKTYKATDEEWSLMYSEAIKVEDESGFKIKVKSESFNGKVLRKFEMQEDGKLKFTDWIGEQIKRTGITTSKIPLVFDGEVSEFYRNGQIKSISRYKNNELVSNKNWLPNGDPDVEDIFYSVDKEPLFNDGLGKMHQHVMKTFKESNYDLSSVYGEIIVGFVVKKNGNMGGVRIIKGITPAFNSLALKAFTTLMGTWTPAELDNEPVNYFQYFPINFITNDVSFDSIELSGSQMHWTTN